MEFQFVIPSSNDDLLETDGNNYFVKKVFNSNEIPDLLKGLSIYNKKISIHSPLSLILIQSKQKK